MKRFIFSLIFLALISAGYLFYKQDKVSQQSEVSSIRTDVATQRDLTLAVSATGEVMPLLSSIVKSEVSGRITKLAVEEGDSVQKGDLLVQLDRTSIETKVREAERNVEADKLRLEKSERNFHRLSELHRKDFIGEQEFLDAKTDFELAKLNLEIAGARLEEVQEDLSKTSIVAPHSGMVTRQDIVDGQVISGATSVSNGTELLTLSKMEELFMEAQINEVDVGLLSLGQTAELSFDSIAGSRVPGTVGRIAVSARNENNIRVFPIEVLFEADDARVRPGISATVQVPVASATQAISVLLSAVYLDGGKQYVYVQKGNAWEQREVELGLNDLQFIEIKSGLSVGEVVALSRPLEYRGLDD
ncbi:MAG: efflux RND transporter periplasmic adaptor subunit [Verrucomicrobiota bacterium]